MRPGRFIVYHRISEDGMFLERVVVDTENEIPMDISLLKTDDAIIIAQGVLSIVSEIQKNRKEQ